MRARSFKTSDEDHRSVKVKILRKDQGEEVEGN